jgi:hypothetical protein
VRRLLAGLVVLLLCPAQAPAGDSLKPTPADAPVVAGPLADGARLVAFDRGDSLCLDVLRPRERISFPDCQRGTPVSLRQVRPTEEFGPRPTWHYGVVPAAVAAVEVELTTGERTRVATEPGDAYTGTVAAPDDRFFLTVTPGNDRPQLLRMFAADGTLIAVTDDPFADFRPDGRPPGPRVAGGRGFAVFGHRMRRLAPTPLEPERYDTTVCATARLVAEPGRGDVEACTFARRGLFGNAALVRVGGSCDAGLVVGLTAARVRRVVLVLGDGTRRSVRTRTARVLRARRAFGLRIGPDVAVRRYVALDGRGRGVARGWVRSAPSFAQCPPPEAQTSFGSFAVAIAVVTPRRAPVPAGAPPLVAYDRGDELCVGPGAVDPRADCALPPLEPFETRIQGVRSRGRTLLAGVVAPEVTGVRLVLDGGEHVTVPAVADPAYTGKYAGHVRFVSLALSGSRSVLRVRLLGLGRPQTWWVNGLDPRPTGTRTIAPGVTASVLPGVRRPTVCVELSGWPCASKGSFGVQAVCGRGITAGGLLGPHTRRIVAVLADGRRVRARVVRVPAGFPQRPRVWMLSLERGMALERIVGVGPDGGVAWQRLPAARDQCGYDSFGFLAGGSLLSF